MAPISDFLRTAPAPDDKERDISSFLTDTPPEGAPRQEVDMSAFTTQHAPSDDEIMRSFGTRRAEDGLTVKERRDQLLAKGPGLVKAWSFSTMTKAETCMYAVYLQKVRKIRIASGEAAQRGNEVHDNAEAFIRGQTDKLHLALRKHYLDEMQSFREQFAATPDAFSLEDNWGFGIRDTTDEHGHLVWYETGFFDKDVWARFKLDMMKRHNDTSASIHDWKTGKKFGNEMKHSDQGFQYALASFLKYPDLQHTEVVFHYVDHGLKMERDYTRSQIMAMRERTESRGLALTHATEQQLMVPSPSPSNCKFCDFKKTGDCPYAE